MSQATTPASAPVGRLVRRLPYWRELLFWTLLLPAFAALGSGKSRREIAGLIETCAFLFVAIVSVGRLKTLGLEFIAWERMTRTAIGVCAVCGLVAGVAVIAVAKLSGQPLGVPNGWNMVVLAVILGPIAEEVLFRGYLMSLALRLTRGLAQPLSSAISVFSVAGLFAAAHFGTAGISGLQAVCIATTGSLYGWTRLRFRSSAAAALTHATYNLALCVRYWLGGG